MKYDDVEDVSITYIGQESIRLNDVFKPEQDFPFTPTVMQRDSL